MAHKKSGKIKHNVHKKRNKSVSSLNSEYAYLGVNEIKGEIQKSSKLVENIKQEIKKVVIGQDKVVKDLIVSLICEGNVLLEGDELKANRIYEEEKETQPPKRYTQASIIKTMEKLNLGTKATRAIILDTLYQRGYIQHQPLEATELGITIVETLSKHLPEILDEKLTSEIEDEMELIREGKKDKKETIEKTIKFLEKILKKFKKNEIEIGKELTQAYIDTGRQMNELGLCPVCKTGIIRTIYSQKTKKRFAACNAYPKCKTTFSLPQQGLLKKGEPCKFDSYPQVIVIRKGKRPWTLCLKSECKSKENWNNKVKAS